MTKTELEKQIAEMQEQFDKMQKQLDQLKQVKVEKLKKRWKPEKSDTYYCVNVSGIIVNVYWNNDAPDGWRYLTNNVFKTEEETVEYQKKIEIQAQFRNFVEERSEELDWNDMEQSKWKIYYSYKYKEIKFCFTNYCKTQGVIYASSERILRDAIAEIGEYNIKKYVLEVEDE